MKRATPERLHGSWRRGRYEVLFKSIGDNHIVPMQPWPQTFHVSRHLLEKDAVELRPLTVTGFVKGVARNFVAMNVWRVAYVLRRLGFLTTAECCRYSWRDFTLRFWRYQRVDEFRFVQRLQRRAL